MDVEMGLSDLSDLQNQVLDRLAENMQQSLDFAIRCGMLSEMGWTVLEVDYNPNDEQGWNTVINWAEENFQGQWEEHKGKWLIEMSKDATMFALRWKVQPQT